MTVSAEYQDNIAVITIDDGNKNVINHDVLDELEAHWDKAEQEAAAIVLCGRPGSFCAGYDISVMTGDNPEAAATLGQRGGRFGYRLYGSSKPLIGVSTGHAFTIGAVWLACCDIRIGEEGNFKYSMSEVKLGVPFGAWPLEPLKARLNPASQIEALLHAAVYAPADAVNAGFIDQLVAAGTGVDTAIHKARELAKLPGEAYAQSKRSLRKSALAIMADDLGL